MGFSIGGSKKKQLPGDGNDTIRTLLVAAPSGTVRPIRRSWGSAASEPVTDFSRENTRERRYTVPHALMPTLRLMKLFVGSSSGECLSRQIKSRQVPVVFYYS
jgi:hypothetical protein